ncbi:ureidoglycolate lyase [Paenalcaligenes niemegkensis]|uniref:ureidoglycolate lyase n=1 Tax=Paenalcaligenes niemegkensis TaxID=2895469 RepID=UPI001EE8B7C4|nr:ureidoglycolate lyase [Paenalcaligenes niemegkensis]MCQ9616482.1 ureidoglycolate lyase [Paenalcaligenes niemegkensis]
MSTLLLHPQPLTSESFAPYGTVLGTPYTDEIAGFSNPASDFWHQHYFQAGHGGVPEILWVNYRNAELLITELEVHWETQQAIVPLGERGIIHVVALSHEGTHEPDPQSMRAFFVLPGQGISMNAGCWHTTRILRLESTCLMLTRGSTTVELAAHLREGPQACETSFAAIDARIVVDSVA